MSLSEAVPDISMLLIGKGHSTAYEPGVRRLIVSGPLKGFASKGVFSTIWQAEAGITQRANAAIIGLCRCRGCRRQQT